MPKILLSAAVASIAGKLNGSTFQNSPSGLILRSSARRKVPFTPFIFAQQQRVRVVAEIWPYLTAAQRESWFPNDWLNRNGLDLFRHINNYRLLLGYNLLLTYGPPPLAVPSGRLSGLGYNAAGSVSMSIAAPANYADFEWVVWFSKPVPPSRSPLRGPLYYQSHETANAGASFFFDHVIGNKYHWQILFPATFRAELHWFHPASGHHSFLSQLLFP